MLVDKVKRQQRVAQMIKYAHEDYEIELLAELADIVGRHLSKFDLQSVDLGRKSCLCQIFIFGIETNHALGTPTFHFHGVETRIAADVENGLPFESFRNDACKTTPFDPRIVAQEVRRRGADALQVEIVKPGAERIDAAANFLSGEGAAHEVTSVAADEALWNSGAL